MEPLFHARKRHRWHQLVWSSTTKQHATSLHQWWCCEGCECWQWAVCVRFMVATRPHVRTAVLWSDSVLLCSCYIAHLDGSKSMWEVPWQGGTLSPRRILLRLGACRWLTMVDNGEGDVQNVTICVRLFPKYVGLGPYSNVFMLQYVGLLGAEELKKHPYTT